MLVGERRPVHLGVDQMADEVVGPLGPESIVVSGAGDALTGDLRGDLLIAAGHLCWAIYTLAAKPLVAGVLCRYPSYQRVTPIHAPNAISGMPSAISIDAMLKLRR